MLSAFAVTSTADGDVSLMGTLRHRRSTRSTLTRLTPPRVRTRSTLTSRQSDPGYNGATWTIIPTSAALRSSTNPVFIDGGKPLDNRTPIIEISGSGSLNDGLVLGATGSTTSAGSTIEGLTIDSFVSSGIVIDSNGNTLESNVLSDNGGDGLELLGANGNTIGGLNQVNPDQSITRTAGNDFSGNGTDGHGDGVAIHDGMGNVLKGNYIGITAVGYGASSKRGPTAYGLGAVEAIIGSVAAPPAPATSSPEITSMAS